MKPAIKSFLAIGIMVFLVVSLMNVTAFADNSASLASSPIQTHQGETFTTTIFIPDNANILGFDITLKYNTDLITLVSVEENDGIKGSVVFNDLTPGEIVINYTEVGKNITKYTPILDVTFTVDDEVGIGSYECFSVDYTAPFIAKRLNSSGIIEEIDFACDFARLVIYEIGDVDLSESVDIGDAAYIRRYLAKLHSFTDYQLTLADTYYDEIIDIADPVCLQRHLARLDVLYGNRVNITFYDSNGKKFATKSVQYNGTLHTIPAVPANENYASGAWSQSPTENIAPVYTNLTKDISLYAFYSNKKNPAMDYYKRVLTNKYNGSSGDLSTNLSSDLDLVSRIEYQDGWYATLIWNSDCNYVLNSTTGHFTVPTYPQDLALTVTITSRDNNGMIDAEESITFNYAVPGIYTTPTKAEIEQWLQRYFTDSRENSDNAYRVNYDVKLISEIDNEIIPKEGNSYDAYVVHLDWFQNINGTLVPINRINRTTETQHNDYVAVATFNGKPLEGDGKIRINNVEVTAIEQIEIKNYIIQQIAANQSTSAKEGTSLWNNDTVYHSSVKWETGAPDIAYVSEENGKDVIRLKPNAISGTILPLNAKVSYIVSGGETEEFTLSYNLTISCNNTKIQAPQNMDSELYRALKTELGISGDLTSAALANVTFVNLDLSHYPEITSLRGLSYCKNLHTLNISGLHITDGTINQIATLSYLEAFVARGCGLENLTDGGMATLRNATNLKMIDLTDNNLTSLDSVFAEGIRYGALREVYLSKNRLTDINALSRAPMMTYLSLADNGLTTEGIASIENYPYLNYLSLANNQIDSVEHLKGLKYLQELRLQNNNISNVNDLRRLVNLEILYLGHNEIKDIGNLNTLTNLQILYVNDNQIFDISSLRDLSKLEAVNVSNNRLTSLSVLGRYRSSLTEIYAENNSITDFSFINGANNLRILMLAGNKVEMPQSNMTTWLSGLSQLEILTLSDIRLNDLSFLSSMEELARLDVANCGLHAFSGETSNVQMIADRYATLKVLNISNNDLSDNEAEIMKLRDVPLLTVFYADNICHNLDAYTLTYSMTELKYISLENCGISSLNWLYKFHELAYVDLAGNNISDVNLEQQISNASIKTLKQLYLDTNVACSFANAFRVMDFDVERLSLAGITVGKMEYMPNLEKIKYLNLDNTGLTNLTGEDLELADLYSIERYQTLESIDVSHLETNISTVENLASVKTVYAVGATDSKLFYEDNLHALQRLYNKGVTCYLYDKQAEYEPVAQTEGSNILALLPDVSCDVTVAADNVFSDNNPLLQDEINDFDITWTVSNSDNYEVTDNHLSVKSYSGLEDEDLTVTATITVYPDQAPVSRDFTVHTHILRASAKYFNIDATGYSEQLTRDAAFTYALTLHAAETDDFADPVKPVEDSISYSYATDSAIPYPNVLVVKDNHKFAIASNAPLGATVTINIDITHTNKSGAVVQDVERISVPVTVASRTYTVTFHMNGGTIVDGNGLSRESCELVEDALIFENLTFSRAGYTFEGWYTDEALSNLFSETGAEAIMPSHNLDLYAKWNPISFKVYFDPNGGTCSTSYINALSDVALGTLPTPTLTYYTFDGWFTAKEGGTKVTAETKFTRNEDITVYAHWTRNSFVVTFNANGGSVSQTTLRGYCGQKLGTLPTATRDYYSFDGWFTAASGGTQVTANTVYTVAQDIMVYAHWTIHPTSDWVLASSVPAGAQIVDRKWTYTQTSYTTSTTSSSMSGWTLYDTVYSSWSSWSAWQDSAVSANDLRQVETRTGYHYYYYVCSNCGAHMHGYGTCYTWAGGCGKSTVYSNSYHAVRCAVPYSSAADFHGTGVYYTDNTGEGRGFAYINSGSQYYVAPITQYRYRTRTVTYYFKKVEDKESTSYPTGDNITNIKEWVKYRAK